MLMTVDGSVVVLVDFQERLIPVIDFKPCNTVAEHQSLLGIITPRDTG
jgi:hypothetical protein